MIKSLTVLESSMRLQSRFAGGGILHIHGPFPASVHDIDVFRDCLQHKMLPGELCEADKGYISEGLYIRILQNSEDRADRRRKAFARNHHETCNKRFKNWGILKQRYRHDLKDHRLVFGSIAVITQLEIRKGNPLFQLQWPTFDD